MHQLRTTCQQNTNEISRHVTQVAPCLQISTETYLCRHAPFPTAFTRKYEMATVGTACNNLQAFVIISQKSKKRPPKEECLSIRNVGWSTNLSNQDTVSEEQNVLPHFCVSHGSPPPSVAKFGLYLTKFAPLKRSLHRDPLSQGRKWVERNGVLSANSGRPAPQSFWDHTVVLLKSSKLEHSRQAKHSSAEKTVFNSISVNTNHLKFLHILLNNFLSVGDGPALSGNFCFSANSMWTGTRACDKSGVCRKHAEVGGCFAVVWKFHHSWQFQSGGYYVSPCCFSFNPENERNHFMVEAQNSDCGCKHIHHPVKTHTYFWTPTLWRSFG